MHQSAIRSSTSDQILDIAQTLVQKRGYNAFSYADISATLGITKASLHYHFKVKGDLGLSLIGRYENGFRQRLDEIDRQGGAGSDRIRDYVAIYAGVLADHRMCLCGMLAAEFDTLPKPMQSALDHFFDLNERWLTGVLELGRTDGSLRFEGEAHELAQFLVASLEGAMMLARSHGADGRFHSAAKRLLVSLSLEPSRLS
ncbi:MAG: TetR/AcrR family transcriptional regulator [Rhizobiales bacterium]|nr:TetR/AcrR family transcriptional regulator [Hyphomicrobiales bacterium]